MELFHSNSLNNINNQEYQSDLIQEYQTNENQSPRISSVIRQDTEIQQNNRMSPSVRAIIQKYEPNSTISVKRNFSPGILRSSSTARMYGIENLPIGNYSPNEPVGKTALNHFSSIHDNQQQIFNDGLYSARLISKENLSTNLINNNENQCRYEGMKSKYSIENQIPKIIDYSKYGSLSVSQTVPSHRNISDNVPIENSYSYVKKCAKDKCIGTNKMGSILENQPNEIKNENLPERSYQSKTTISKTITGVRIITDIFFDSNIDPNWKGSRIETDIPPSRILKEFQDKYSDEK